MIEVGDEIGFVRQLREPRVGHWLKVDRVWHDERYGGGATMVLADGETFAVEVNGDLLVDVKRCGEVVAEGWARK